MASRPRVIVQPLQAIKRFVFSQNNKLQSTTAIEIASTIQPDPQPTVTIQQVKYSYEEFKLIYESAERVTDRRLANNKLNFSICIALLVGIGYIWNWSNDHIAYTYIVLSLTTLLSLLAALFSWLWLAQIIDYKRLNTAKFAVMNEMAPNIFYNSEKSDITVISYKPFDKEWEKLKALDALQKKGIFKIIGLKSSFQEYFVTIAFIILFLLLLFSSAIPILFHLDQFVDGWKRLLKI